MIEQIAIGVFGVTAIFLTQCENEGLRRYACIFGMLSQPFWMWAAYQAEQWGILGLSVLYALSWGKGINTHWIKRSND